MTRVSPAIPIPRAYSERYDPDEPVVIIVLFKLDKVNAKLILAASKTIFARFHFYAIVTSMTDFADQRKIGCYGLIVPHNVNLNFSGVAFNSTFSSMSTCAAALAWCPVVKHKAIDSICTRNLVMAKAGPNDNRC